ncbi:MAG TPA: hypothetical protein VF469_40680 [Kofleriaceae bacterium]
MVLAANVFLGCGQIESVIPDEAASTDPCDPLAPFDPPQLVAGIGANGSPADPALSPDELTLLLTQTTPAGDRDVYVASRSHVTDAFGAPVPLASVDSTSEEASATLASTGLMLMFQSHRIAAEGEHLFVATRSSLVADFGAPALVAGVRSPVATDSDLEPFLTADGQELWFISDRTGNREIFRAEKAGAGFANPVLVPELSSPSSEQHVTLSADRLTVYFSSNRQAAGTSGGFDVYRAHRSSVTDDFGTPVPVPELNTAGDDSPRWLSADSCRLYMHAKVGTGFKLFVATRHPAS